MLQSSTLHGIYGVISVNNIRVADEPAAGIDETAAGVDETAAGVDDAVVNMWRVFTVVGACVVHIISAGAGSAGVCAELFAVGIVVQVALGTHRLAGNFSATWSDMKLYR